MKIALIGLPQVGKKTVFSLLTGIAYDQLLARGGEYHVGTVKVADPRVEKLSAMYNPKKTKHAEIECTLAPAPPHEPKPREQWLNKLKDMDALSHVVRAFENPAVFHAKGTVDALRDIDEMNLELTISDLALIELRLNRIAQDQKALLSYSYDGTVMTIDPVSTANPGWFDYLDAYNKFCVERNGKPLPNQTPGLDANIVQNAYGERLKVLADARREYDPQGRLLNAYFRELLS